MVFQKKLKVNKIEKISEIVFWPSPTLRKLILHISVSGFIMHIYKSIDIIIFGSLLTSFEVSSIFKVAGVVSKIALY